MVPLCIETINGSRSLVSASVYVLCPLCQLTDLTHTFLCSIVLDESHKAKALKPENDESCKPTTKTGRKQPKNGESYKPGSAVSPDFLMPNFPSLSFL
jgi:hypothetical protein